MLQCAFGALKNIIITTNNNKCVHRMWAHCSDIITFNRRIPFSAWDWVHVIHNVYQIGWNDKGVACVHNVRKIWWLFFRAKQCMVYAGIVRLFFWLFLLCWSSSSTITNVWLTLKICWCQCCFTFFTATIYVFFLFYVRFHWSYFYKLVRVRLYDVVSKNQCAKNGTLSQTITFIRPRAQSLPLLVSL